jgi:hypothetical protein
MDQSTLSYLEGKKKEICTLIKIKITTIILNHMFHIKLRFNKQVSRNTPITDYVYDLTARLDIFLNDVFSILSLDFL